MGWLDKLRRKPKTKTTYAQMLNGYTPIYSQFGDDIYASDVVQQAINCIVMECKKLIPQHVKETGSDVIPVNSNVQTVLNDPNEIMTTTDFIEKIIWQLYFNYNAFIIPTWYTRKESNGSVTKVYTGLYPIAPTNVEILQDANDKLYVKFTFANGFETTLNYSDVIHIRKNYSVNEYMGGNEFGQPDNEALLKTLDLNWQLLRNLSKAMVSSCAVNGIVKYNTMMDDGKTELALKELEEKLKNSESGFLPLDIRAEFTPIEREIQMVDESTLKFIDEKILRHFGVPLCILTGDYTKEQYEAFFQKTIEPIVRTLSQSFTKTIFTPRERSFGNQIKFYTKDLIFLSTDQTLEMVNLLGASGSLYENEKRVAFGMRPLPELVGVRMMSLNYVNVAYAKEYQLNQKGDNNE
ncbi:MAG: phage portal protein [Ruminococcus sp.]|nr:phage portal protein [Ruminococcus sp.]DAU60415.1 MAG TPA: portal protein [Caudoviricetes sp.]